VRVLWIVALAVIVLVPRAVAAEEPGRAPVLDWDTGAGKSYWIPALELGGFIFGLNQFNRHFVDPPEEYDTDLDSIGENLSTAPVYDKDPFSVNQIGHPYQGGIYYGLARSAGLDYWQALLYTLGGSLLWETAGETTPPSINDHISTGIGGTFRGRGDVPHGQPAARGWRRHAGVLARAGRGGDLAAHGLQSPRLRRPLQTRLPEP
jgi:hypothetical protein